MLDHMSIQCSDVEASKRFYDTVLAPLGGRRVMDFGNFIGYGTTRPNADKVSSIEWHFRLPQAESTAGRKYSVQAPTRQCHPPSLCVANGFPTAVNVNEC